MDPVSRALPTQTPRGDRVGNAGLFYVVSRALPTQIPRGDRVGNAGLFYVVNSALPTQTPRGYRVGNAGPFCVVNRALPTQTPRGYRVGNAVNCATPLPFFPKVSPFGTPLFHCGIAFFVFALEFQNVAGLAVEGFANRLQGAEANRLRLAGLQNRQVGKREVNPCRQFVERHFALGHHHI